MNEDVDIILGMTKESMQSTLDHLEKELSHIRAGKANTKMLDSIMVEYYGAMTPLSQVANVTTPDAKTIAIQPWEKKMIGVIEKAILVANLGFNPENNGEMIRIFIPPLTEERRKSLVKDTNKEGESAKVGIRNVRKDANEQLKKLQKNGLSEDEEKDAEGNVQQITDNFAKKVEDMIAKKCSEIMTI